MCEQIRQSLRQATSVLFQELHHDLHYV